MILAPLSRVLFFNIQIKAIDRNLTLNADPIITKFQIHLLWLRLNWWLNWVVWTHNLLELFVDESHCKEVIPPVEKQEQEHTGGMIYKGLPGNL